MDQQTDNIRIPSEPFQTFISRLYQSVDSPEADADTVAHMQVETDERGFIRMALVPCLAMYAVSSKAKSILNRLHAY